MKLELPSSTDLDGVSINNGEFDIIVDNTVFRMIMEHQQRTHDEAAALWGQFARFASEVEMSRLSGFALGSSDPVGALDDQIHRFNVTAGRDLSISDDDIASMIKPR